MRELGSFALVGALAGAVVAAGVVPSYAQDARFAISPAAEARQAARDHPQTLARLGGAYRSARVAAYVGELGQRLVATRDDRGYTFHFYAVDSADVFAIAQAGGYIYISRGMITLATTEAEIAAVLAHEIAHVLLRHGAQRMQLRDDQRGADAPADEDAAVLNAFTRDQELEADAFSIGVLAEAGYLPTAQAQFLEMVGRESDLSRRSGFTVPANPSLNSHPDLAERIERANEIVLDVQAEARRRTDLGGAAAYNEAGEHALLPSAEGRDELLAAIDGAVFGRRPDQGMSIGQTYINTRRRVALELPPGFRFAYIGPTVVAKGPGESTLRMDTATWRRPQETDLEEYIRRTSGGLDLLSMETTTIDGMEAALARAVSKAQVGHLQLGVIRVSSRTIVRFQFFIPAAFSDHMTDAAQQTIRSFRRIPRDEVGAQEPLHIEVVTVESGTTLESLAAQMRLLPHAMEWLLMLNGFTPDHVVQPGDKVKLVVR